MAMLDDLDQRILEWFVEKDLHGSQAGSLANALPHAAEEIGGAIGVHASEALPKLTNLRNRHMIATDQGVGRYQGAIVTTITVRGRDALYGADDVTRLIAALTDLSSALKTAERVNEAKTVDTAIAEVKTIQGSSDRVGQALKALPTAIQTVAALKPAWNAVVGAGRALGIDGLPEIP